MAYETTVPLRYDDLDTAGHVNNARYATVLEEARIDYFRDVIGDELEQVESVVARLEIDFERPLTLDADPTVSVEVTNIGETSLTIASAIRADGVCAASAETVLVAYDFEKQSPRPVPEKWRRAIRRE